MRLLPDTPSSQRPARRRLFEMAMLAAGGCLFADGADAAPLFRDWPAAKAVPAFEGIDLDGRRLLLSEFVGRVVVLNFWATWCEPCRAEMPSLDALGQRHRHDGLAVVAVNYRESAEVVRGFIDRMRVAATIVLDRDGDAASAWTPRVFPSTVLIGRDGRPTVTVLGAFDWSGREARDLIEPLLAAPVPGRERGDTGYSPGKPRPP